jgi:hypothetical protein
MAPLLSKQDNSVSAHCPICRVVTSFGQIQLTTVACSREYNAKTYTRAAYVFSKCARCHHGGLAVILDDGNPHHAVLQSFFPFSVDTVPLPSAVPPDIEAEFREAERCAALEANRAASALFRSTLEKAFKANGYTKANDPTLTDLQKRIDAAADDGVITDARRKKAHDDIRSLGNDVLHDDWREVTYDEVEAARHYTQRILEDLYDDRQTVELLLSEKNRVPTSHKG